MLETVNNHFEVGGFKCFNLFDNDQAQVFACESTGNNKMKEHTHVKSCETFIILEGTLTVNTQKKHVLKPGCKPFHVKPGVKHSVETKKPCKFLTVIVPAELAYRRHIQRE